MVRHVACIALALSALMATGCEDKSASSTSLPKIDKGAAPKAVSVPSMDSAVTEQAKTLLNEVNDAIKNAKLDVAEQALKKLEEMKQSLSSSLQDQIEAARMSLDAAKAKS